MARINRFLFENGYRHFHVSSYDKDKHIGIDHDCFNLYAIYDSASDKYLNFHDIVPDMLSTTSVRHNHTLDDTIDTLMVRHNFGRFDEILAAGMQIADAFETLTHYNLSLHMYPVVINLFNQSITVSWMNGHSLC